MRTAACNTSRTHGFVHRPGTSVLQLGLQHTDLTQPYCSRLCFLCHLSNKIQHHSAPGTLYQQLLVLLQASGWSFAIAALAGQPLQIVHVHVYTLSGISNRLVSNAVGLSIQCVMFNHTPCDTMCTSI